MVIYALKEATDGQWSVCRSGCSLFNNLRLAAAIKLAREVARDEHMRSGRPVCVEMPGPEPGSAIRLAQYARKSVTMECAA